MLLSKPSLSVHDVHKEIYSERPKKISLMAIVDVGEAKRDHVLKFWMCAAGRRN
jgi:hypothetical protein